MSALQWDELIADLRGDDVDRALAASEQIAAQITAADLPRVYPLAEDEDYFVRVMAGDILAKSAGVAALPTLLAIMLRNEEEGFDNDGLDHATKALIDTNPITARTTLEQFARNGTPQAKKLAEWGLEGVPEESTVVTPMVIPPPPPKPVWYRSCLIRVGLLLVVALGGFSAWAYVPPLGNHRDCTKGTHAAWISVDWTSTPVDPIAVDYLGLQSRNYNLAYLYPYTSYLQEDGTFNETYAYAYEFVQAFRAVNTETKLLAWVGIPLKNTQSFGIQGWVELSDPAIRQQITTFVVQMVKDNGFDGVHLNVETVWDHDADFLLLLEEVSAALGEDALVSVAGSHWAPGIVEPLGLRWSKAYYREVASRVDQIATMTYDSRAFHPAIYRFWMREQVRGIAESIAPTGTEVLIGISVSDEATTSHNPMVESLVDGLAGICAGNDSMVDGVALYAAWETDTREWDVWQGWVE